MRVNLAINNQNFFIYVSISAQVNLEINTEIFPNTVSIRFHWTGINKE